MPLTLKGVLEKQRDHESDAIIRGVATDFADYRYRVGRVKALSDAIDLCQKAMDETSD